MSQRTFLRGRQWLDGVEPTWTLLTFDSSQAMQCDATDLLLRARTRQPLRHNPSALTQPPIPVARSPPRQLHCAPRATGHTGRASGPTGQGQATAEAVQRAASGMPQNTRPAAPARRRPRAAACRAVGRSPTKSDLVGWSFKCSPNADRAEVRSLLKSA